MDKSIEIKTVPQNAALHSVSAEIPRSREPFPCRALESWLYSYFAPKIFDSGFRPANPDRRVG
ncbi:MAG: hypothetical protein Ct9H90mP11_11160 [Acidimicrobiales bacterium]|nr:MAG: hypothetical protein Ct9H90mP11_11160 [Acidimicrobiales bacterium]